jgi:transcriptional regulator with XRE-family HTH domain
VNGTDGGEYALLDNHKIGKNILQLRKRQSLTQTELSKRLGVSHQAVSKWENGECLPDIEVLLQLGRIFGKSVEEILLFEREMDDAAAETPTPLWDTVLAEIKKRLSKPSLDTWFKHTTGELVEGVLCIYSPSNFATEWLYTRYAAFILAILNELTDEPDLIVEFRSRDSSSKGPDLISPNRARLSSVSSGWKIQPRTSSHRQ